MGGFIRGGEGLIPLRRIVLNAYTVNRELDAVAFELLTIGNRTHRGGVLVQKVDLLKGQSLSLKKEVGLSVVIRERIN